MGDYQRLDTSNIEAQVLFGILCVSPLLEAAIHQQTAVIIQVELMAGASDAAGGAMMRKDWIAPHGRYAPGW
ncbi:hypothetical protein D3C77_405560 [compost metagenome]